MRVRDFLGKFVDLDRIHRTSTEEPHDEADQSQYEAEIWLSDHPRAPHSHDYNAFSLVLFLAENKIVRIQRLAHFLMCGGQGVATDVKRFPYASLENEATRELKSVVISPQKARRQLPQTETNRQKEPPRTTTEDSRLAEMLLKDSGKLLGRLRNAVASGAVEGNDGTKAIVAECTALGLRANDVFELGLSFGLDSVIANEVRAGGSVFAPKILAAARAVIAGIEVLKRVASDFRHPRRGDELLVQTRICSRFARNLLLRARDGRP